MIHYTVLYYKILQKRPGRKIDLNGPQRSSREIKTGLSYRAREGARDAEAGGGRLRGGGEGP